MCETYSGKNSPTADRNKWLGVAIFIHNAFRSWAIYHSLKKKNQGPPPKKKSFCWTTFADCSRRFPSADWLQSHDVLLGRLFVTLMRLQTSADVSFPLFREKKGFQAEDLAPGHTGTLVRRQKNRPKEKCKPSTSRRHRNEDLRARGSGSNYRVISVPQPNACGHGETWQNMHIVLLLGGSVACGPSWPIVLSEFFYCSGRNSFSNDLVNEWMKLNNLKFLNFFFFLER